MIIRHNDTRLALNSAYLDIDTARTTITSAEKAVALAQENSRLAKRRFAEGVGPVWKSMMPMSISSRRKPVCCKPITSSIPPISPPIAIWGAWSRWHVLYKPGTEYEYG